jgi:hypothetical protein
MDSDDLVSVFWTLDFDRLLALFALPGNVLRYRDDGSGLTPTFVLMLQGTSSFATTCFA